jgi:hypothetical protein
MLIGHNKITISEAARSRRDALAKYRVQSPGKFIVSLCTVERP